jgi:hypothetical protein
MTIPALSVDGYWSAPAWYIIRLRGTLDATWAHLFKGFTISHDSTGDTILSGTRVDQAAFYGVMSRARDLGLTVLAVERRESPDEGLC